MSTFQSAVTMRNNIITDNWALMKGGGIFFYHSDDCTIERCLVSNNSSETGGGVYIEISPNTVLNNCTIADNEADNWVGGLFTATFSFPVITNCIVWNNNAPQQSGIYSAGDDSLTVNYSDIQAGYSGIGNICLDPLFLNPGGPDYHLQPNSPCIDAGDPSYPLDPDSTISDMGMFYFDQRIYEIQISAVPDTLPIVIPASGGNFGFTVNIENTSVTNQIVNAWSEVILPNSSIYGPLFSRSSVNLNPGQLINRRLTQNIPAGAPSGAYQYRLMLEESLYGFPIDSSGFDFVKE